MLKTLLRAVIFLLALAAGLAVYQIYRYRVILFSSGEAAHFQPPSVEGWDSYPPIRLGVFIGVEGVTFSADGSKFNMYDDHKDQETAVLVSQDELSDIVGKLVAAGLLEEKEMNSPLVFSLPLDDTIIVAWPDETREFSWIVRDECRVPERYLFILDEVNSRRNVPLIRRVLNHNRPELFPIEGAF
jgi:hypothetical protein